ncbi:hypothetical protein [Palaeococcus ferrophilus]|nr:hypothetical protein [Palaeococcus ferrophilus]
MTELKPTFMVKTKEREFEIDPFESGENAERVKVRFVQEVRRYHLA